MTRYFYAVDYAEKASRGEGVPDIRAFSTRTARDGYIDDGNRRFAKTRDEANNLCKKHYGRNIGDCIEKGLI